MAHDSRLRVAALALAVGLVLADSSVVVLALPRIYRDLDTSVAGVTWVLISFNLVLALAAVPVTLLARRLGPGRVVVVGLAVFAGAGLACGLSATLPALIAARCVQALGGAAAVTAALEMLPSQLSWSGGAGRAGGEVAAAEAGADPEHRATVVWVAAGATGAALGPALGGILTQLVSWQSIFLLQAPVALAAAAPILAVGWGGETPRAAAPQRRRAGRPHLAANIALAMVSAAIAAALFLLVLLLIEGWRLSPIAAAIVVSVMPVAAVFGSRLGPLVPAARPRAAAGAILVAGGLGGLALLPRASVALTLPPQVLVGVGLALVLSALTEAALAGRAPQAIHGGWTISSRHAGVVIGLLALTPIFTHDIAQQRHDAINAGTAVILESRVEPLLKLELAQRIAKRLEGERGKVPTLGPAFEPLPSDPGRRAEVEQLHSELQDQLNRGATHAFSPSFALAALLGLLALLPIVLTRRVDL